MSKELQQGQAGCGTGSGADWSCPLIFLAKKKDGTEEHVYLGYNLYKYEWEALPVATHQVDKKAYRYAKLDRLLGKPGFIMVDKGAGPQPVPSDNPTLVLDTIFRNQLKINQLL